jgi:hypothetical protein
MWKAFRFVFGAVLGYFFAIAFIFGAIIFGGAFLVGFLSAPQQQQQQPYHTTKATRS